MNTIISAISNRIYDTFGPDYDIHLENVEQDFKTPAFSIVPIISEYKDCIMGVEENIHNFDIIYYPEHEHFRQELIDVGDLLKKAFKSNLLMDEGLKTMQTVPVFDRKTKIVDDVLHFTFRLDFFIDTYQSDSEFMKDLDQDFEVNEIG